MDLAKLKKVALRDVWPHEAADFTNWLAEEDNLAALSEEIGVEISLVQTEASVGKFNVDILAEEQGGRKIIIENQLEATDHDHLGKIITYAAGHDAEIVIWVVKDVREEHHKALDWLNDNTGEDLSFFLVKIELWQIEGSKPAPKFEIVVSPNEWAKAIKSTPRTAELSETKLQQLDFWKRFTEHVRENDTQIRLRTPRPQHWFDVSMGSSDSHVSLSLNTRENLMGCEVYIGRNKDFFNFLVGKKEEIVKAIGEEPEYVDAAVASRVKINKSVEDVFDQDKAEEYFDWLYEKTVLFQNVFSKLHKEFKSS